MKEAISWLLVIFGLIIVLVFGCAQLNESAANKRNAQAAVEYARGQARAMVIEAQAESRLHSAQAHAQIVSANMPMGIIGLATVLVLFMFTGSLVVIVYFRQTPPAIYPRTIERIETRTIIYLPPGTSRREFWRLISESGDVKMLAGPKRGD